MRKKVLIKRQTKLNQLLVDGVKEGNLCYVKWLLKEGADPNTCCNGDAALVCAVEDGHTEIALELIKAGADIEVRAEGYDLNMSGLTPLMIAAYRDHYETAIMLVENGADVCAEDHSHNIALDYAQGRTWDYLVQKVNVAKRRFPWKETHLFGAGASQIPVLLERGVPVDARTRAGETALMCARDGESVKLLIEAGAKVDDRDVSGLTPLLHAAQENRADVVRALLEAGADLQARDADGNNALMLAASAACWNGDACVRQLLGLGVLPVEGKNKKGQTALMKAAYSGNKDAARRLLNVGANVNARDNEGKTPLMYTTFRWQYKYTGTNKAMAEYLLGAGAEVNARDRYGRTPLMYASGTQAADVVSLIELFISNGADLAIRDNDGQSPLMKAAVSGSKRAVQTCLDAGFDMNETDLHGNTPLSLAAANSHDPEIIQLLVDAGAKADVTVNGKDIFALIEENKHRQERRKYAQESRKPDWDDWKPLITNLRKLTGIYPDQDEIDFENGRKIELVHEENSSGSFYIDVSLKDGELCFSGQDFGKSVEDFWGSDEYEYWYRFAPGQTEDLWRLLGCAEAPLSKKLTVLKARVHDLSSFTELRELCDKNGITYGFYSYC